MLGDEVSDSQLMASSKPEKKQYDLRFVVEKSIEILYFKNKELI